MVGDGVDVVITITRNATLRNAAAVGPAIIVTLVCINIIQGIHEANVIKCKL